MANADDDAWVARVDALIAAPLTRGRATSGGDTSYRSAARTALAGRWLGAYLQPFAAFGPVWMDLEVSVTASSSDHAVLDIAGRGVDPIDDFHLYGTVDPGTGEVRLKKAYVDRHAVDYDGTLDERGVIRGVWSLAPMSGSGLFVFCPASALEADVAARLGRRARSSRLVFGLLQLVAMLTFPIRLHPIVRNTLLVRRWRSRRELPR